MLGPAKDYGLLIGKAALYTYVVIKCCPSACQSKYAEPCGAAAQLMQCSVDAELCGAAALFTKLLLSLSVSAPYSCPLYRLSWRSECCFFPHFYVGFAKDMADVLYYGAYLP